MRKQKKVFNVRFGCLYVGGGCFSSSPSVRSQSIETLNWTIESYYICRYNNFDHADKWKAIKFAESEGWNVEQTEKKQQRQQTPKNKHRKSNFDFIAISLAVYLSLFFINFGIRNIDEIWKTIFSLIKQFFRVVIFLTLLLRERCSQSRK